MAGMNLLARRGKNNRVVDRVKSKRTGTLFAVLPFLRQVAVIRKGAGLFLAEILQGNLAIRIAIWRDH